MEQFNDNTRSMPTIEAMEKYGGSFVKALSVCLRLADDTNYKILENAFPEYFKQYAKMGLKDTIENFEVEDIDPQDAQSEPVMPWHKSGGTIHIKTDAAGSGGTSTGGQPYFYNGSTTGNANTS